MTITAHTFAVSTETSRMTQEKTEELSLRIMTALHNEPAADVIQALSCVLGSVSAGLYPNFTQSLLSVQRITGALVAIAEEVHRAPSGPAN